MIDALEKELVLLSNKAKYIQENLEGTVDLRKKKKEQVIEMLESKGYDLIGDDIEYKYLTKMPMDSVTEENVEKLLKEKGTKDQELTIIKSTTINAMWSSELNNLLEQYLEYKDIRQRLMDGEDTKLKKKKVVSKGKKVVKNIVVLDE
jgi:DNA topoisomerase-2